MLRTGLAWLDTVSWRMYPISATCGVYVLVSPCPSDVLIAKLETRQTLSEDDKAALRELPCVSREFPPQSYLVREGARPVRCAFLLSGFAMRHKLTADGGRQIVGFMIPGDFTDLQQLFLTESDHNIQSLTRLEVADIATSDLQQLALERPAISQALWIDALIDASMTREMVLNIGRRDSSARIAHVLCEFESRLAAAGLADSGFEMPMTQEQMADATGLTSVHVNRMLQQLERDGLIVRERRIVRIVDWKGLQNRADFNPRYLHLDQAGKSK